MGSNRRREKLATWKVSWLTVLARCCRMIKLRVMEWVTQVVLFRSEVVHARFWLDNPDGKDQMEDVGEDERPY